MQNIMQTVIMFKEQFTNTEKYPDNLLNNVVSLSINIFACNELKFFKQRLKLMPNSGKI